MKRERVLQTNLKAKIGNRDRKPKYEGRSPESAVRSTQRHPRAGVKQSIGHPPSIACGMLEECFEHELDGVFINVGSLVCRVLIWSLVVFLCPLRLLRISIPTAFRTFAGTLGSHLGELLQFQPLSTQTLVH